MTDPQRPPNPFANIVNLATDQQLFTDAPKPTQKSTREITQPRNNSRESSRDKPRMSLSEKLREKARGLPSRDAIQEFSFRLRDDLMVKV